MNTKAVNGDGKASIFTAARERVHRMTQSARAQLCLMDARARTLTAKPEEGAATAEYAAVTVGALGLGGLLISILKSPEIRKLILSIIKAIFNAISQTVSV